MPNDEREHLMGMMAEGEKIGGGEEGELFRALTGALLFDRGRAAREDLDSNAFMSIPLLLTCFPVMA